MLGICCPPLERRKKLIDHFVSLNLGAADAERVADDLLARVDALLSTGLGAMLKQVHASHKA